MGPVLHNDFVNKNYMDRSAKIFRANSCFLREFEKIPRLSFRYSQSLRKMRNVPAKLDKLCVLKEDSSQPPTQQTGGN